MQYVLIATHEPAQCPMSNGQMKELLLDTAPDLPNLAQKAGVSVTAGPYVNREHMILTVVNAESPEHVDRFLVDSRLALWNTVRVVPSMMMEEALDQVRQTETIF